jgi:hypothetical protein
MESLLLVRWPVVWACKEGNDMAKWIAILILTAVNAVNASAGLSRLEALSMIETGDDDSAIGRLGEISRFQIRPQVWRRYSQSSAFANRDVASSVAQKHLDYLQSQFKARTGRDATDFDLYVLWNAGFSYYERHGFSPDRIARLVQDRAQRYLNLRSLPESQQLLYASRLQTRSVVRANNDVPPTD